MCNYLKCIFISLIALLLTNTVNAWDSEQLEIFDLVEEINQNFYNVLNITQDAELPAIKKAFRSLSLVLHPDKNDAADADVQFRQLVAVYEVLRDPGKRACYDEVLKNGLPNWRSAVYYYRHVRKMGLAETLLTLFVVVTIGQYLVAWGAYVEKRYTAEQVYGARLKKLQRKRGAESVTADQMLEQLQISRPSLWDTLPVQVPRAAWAAAAALPGVVRAARDAYVRRRAEQQQDEESSGGEDEAAAVVCRPARRRKPAFVPVERADSELPPRPAPRAPHHAHAAPAPVSGGLWTDDDLGELVQLVKRYPGGTTERWERIAEAMGRAVPEVTYMAAKLKDNCYRLPGQPEDAATALQPAEGGDAEPPPPRKQKTRGGKLAAHEATAASWSQLQQKALEAALAKHPKGPADRWERIAKCVPDKTKEECMLRYKHLAELVKKQREQRDPGAEDAPPDADHEATCNGAAS